jgi:Beta-lactamase
VTRSAPLPKWAAAVEQGRQSVRAGYRVGWDLQTVTLAGEPTGAVGHDCKLGGGMVGSLMMFPERRIVVSVASNISYPDTSAVALEIVQAFAEKAKQPL